MNIVQTSSFNKTVKKLHKNKKSDLDKAVKEVVENPSIGDEKVGDLSGVSVYKFKMAKQLSISTTLLNKIIGISNGSQTPWEGLEKCTQQREHSQE